MPEVVAPQTPAPAPAPRKFVLPDEPAPQTELPLAEQAPAEGETPPAQDTAEQAPATAPDGDEKSKPEATPEQAAKREGRRFERKLDKAYRRAAEAQARADLAEKELSKYRAQTPATADPAAPRLEDFKDIEEFAVAREKYAADKALKNHTEKQRADAQKRELDSIAESWAEKAERASEKYDDWDEVVGDVKPTMPWAIAAMEADNAGDIMYYLGKDDAKEAKRIAALPPRSQIREIGKIEAKLSAEPPKPKTPSKAPAPITPLTGAVPVVTDVPSDNDDIGAWIKKRSKQVHGRR